MMGWTLAVDIDGTITENGNGIIHLGALGALRNAVAMGHKVVYVTGRSSVEAYVLSVFGGTGDLAVGENGGCITAGPRSRVQPGDADKTGGDAVPPGRNIGAPSHVKLGDITECRRAYEALRDIMPDMREKPVFPRMTEVVLERTFDAAEAARILRREHPGVAISDSGYAVHINSRGIDKGRGLRELYAKYGVDKDYTIAIGDSDTDVPMFEEAGLSVAVANAPPKAAGAADMVTASPRGDGVLEALQALAPRMAEGPP